MAQHEEQEEVAEGAKVAAVQAAFSSFRASGEHHEEAAKELLSMEAAKEPQPIQAEPTATAATASVRKEQAVGYQATEEQRSGSAEQQQDSKQDAVPWLHWLYCFLFRCVLYFGVLGVLP